MKEHPRLYGMLAKNEHGFDLICSLCQTVILRNIPDKRTAFTNCGPLIEHAAVCPKSEEAEGADSVQCKVPLVCV